MRRLALLLAVVIPIALLVASIGFLVFSFAKLFEQMGIGAALIAAFIANIAALSVIFGAFAAIGITFGLGGLAIIGIFSGIAGAIGGIDTKKLKDLATVMAAINGVTSEGEVKVKSSLENANELAKTLSTTVSIKPMLENLALISTGTSANTMTAGAGVLNIGGNMGNVSSAIKELAKMVGKGREITLNAPETKKFLEEGYLKIHRETN